MAKRTYCDEHGHTYQGTTSPGWFRCEREVSYSAKKGTVERCGAVALCPGCLGYRLAGYVVLFCTNHAAYSLNDFPLMLPVPETFVSPDADQLSFW